MRHKGSWACLVQAIEFYKAWDRYGSLSNFSPHPVVMPESPPVGTGQVQAGSSGGPMRRWQTLEHYYQAQKFAGESHRPHLTSSEDCFRQSGSEE